MTTKIFFILLLCIGLHYEIGVCALTVTYNTLYPQWAGTETVKEEVDITEVGAARFFQKGSDIESIESSVSGDVSFDYIYGGVPWLDITTKFKNLWMVVFENSTTHVFTYDHTTNNIMATKISDGSNAVTATYSTIRFSARGER